MPPRSVIEDNRESVLSMYRNNHTIKEIANSYGRHYGTVLNKLKEWGEPIRGRHMSAAEKSEALQRLLDGESAGSIGKSLGFKHDAISRVARANGMDISGRQKTNPVPMIDRKEEIIRLYCDEKVGSSAIGKRFGYMPHSVTYSLRKWGIPVRTARQNAHPVREDFFQAIDSEESAYVLGMLMADGCNYQKKGMIQLSLADQDVVEKIAKVMEYGGPIAKIELRGKMTKPQYVLRIGSRKMSDRLAELGCVAQKSKKACFPTDAQVPRHLISHFIRGWFDGDGWIGRLKKANVWLWGICGTEAAITGIASAVAEATGVQTIVRRKPNPKTGHVLASCEVLSGRKLDILLKWLYEDATIYMDRKFDRYQAFLRRTLWGKPASERGIQSHGVARRTHPSDQGDD